MKWFARYAVFVAMCAALLVSTARGNRADPFLAKWKITLSPDEDARKAGEKEISDILLFQGDKFSAESFVKRGFAPATYEEDTRRMGPAKFTVELSSAKEG